MDGGEVRQAASSVLTELTEIEAQLHTPLVRLSRLERSFILGCLKEAFIEPNKDVRFLGDYEILLRQSELSVRLEQLDIVLGLQNQLQKRGEPRKRLFAERNEVIDAILGCTSILYSATPQGEIYKVGILTGDKKGLALEMSHCSMPSRFSIDRLSETAYMSSGSIGEMLNLLDRSFALSQPNAMQQAFRAIVTKMFKRQTNGTS